MIIDKLDNWIFLAMTAGGAILGAVLLWLIIISKNGFSQSDVEAHSSDYGGVVREGHGPMLIYLWVIFTVIIALIIGYWVASWPFLIEINTY